MCCWKLIVFLHSLVNSYMYFWMVFPIHWKALFWVSYKNASSFLIPIFGQKRSILIKQDWSVKDLVYGWNKLFFCWTKQEVSIKRGIITIAASNFRIWGPVHTYPDIFESAPIFCGFKNFHVHTYPYSNWICPSTCIWQVSRFTLVPSTPLGILPTEYAS